MPYFESSDLSIYCCLRLVHPILERICSGVEYSAMTIITKHYISCLIIFLQYYLEVFELYYIIYLFKFYDINTHN